MGNFDLKLLQYEESRVWDLPGGPTVKNLPFNSGNMGSIPGQGTMIPRVMEQIKPMCDDS